MGENNVYHLRTKKKCHRLSDNVHGRPEGETLSTKWKGPGPKGGPGCVTYVPCYFPRMKIKQRKQMKKYKTKKRKEKDENVNV